jgi:hypothetical protein
MSRIVDKIKGMTSQVSKQTSTLEPLNSFASIFFGQRLTCGTSFISCVWKKWNAKLKIKWKKSATINWYSSTTILDSKSQIIIRRLPRQNIFLLFLTISFLHSTHDDDDHRTESKSHLFLNKIQVAFITFSWRWILFSRSHLWVAMEHVLIFFNSNIDINSQ